MPPFPPCRKCTGSARGWLTDVAGSQTRPADELQYAVDQLVTLLSALEQEVFAPYERDVAAHGATVQPLIVLCHRRSGLIAHAAIKQLGRAGLLPLLRAFEVCTIDCRAVWPA